MLWIDDFDFVGRLDIGRRHRASAFFLKRQNRVVTVVQLDNHAFEIQKQVNDVFLHAFQRGILMHHPSDRHFGWRVARHRRQQHATKRVAKRVAVATLKRLHHNASAGWTGGLNLNVARFQKSSTLHTRPLQ